MTASAAEPPRCLLLDGAVVGSTIVAVGERGVITISPDSGQTWRSVQSSTNTTLTGISFGDARHGWAVGHDALILTTSDGGESWAKQWQGENLADSFLAVLALDSTHVIAIGAYGLCLTTSDSGQQWSRRKILDDDHHLNRITRGPGKTLYIAGEHGTLLKSTDRGEHWTAMRTDCDGSFFGIIPIDERTLVAHGLRGHIYRSADDGATWNVVETTRTELLATGTKLPNGPLVLAGNSRTLLVSSSATSSFRAVDVGLTGSVAELLLLHDGNLIAFGEFGAARIEAQRMK